MFIKAGFIAFLFLTGFSLSSHASAQSISLPKPSEKKNFCTITINSDDEKKLFKTYLSEKLWNFIELTPENTNADNRNWFHAACEKKITCDVLAISGHFGGTFFGSSNLNLSLADLEKYSCDSECDGILNKPKEVFLFGCNTLASKEKDSRTPEEYMQILINDGFSYERASQIVSFRYSAFGDSFKSKMTQVFSPVPRIYGFSSVGPSGKRVTPALTDYLKKSTEDYEHFDQYIRQSSTQKNNKLFSTFSKIDHLSQTSGANLKMKSSDEKPYCYIRNDKIKTTEKLKYIDNLFKIGKAITFLTHIEDFFRTLKKQSLSREEQKLKDLIASNPKINNDLKEILNLKGEVYLPLKANVINTLKDLDIIDNQFADKKLTELINFNDSFNSHRKDIICSLNLELDISGKFIPEARWSEPDFLATLLCLKSNSDSIQQKMLSIINTTNNQILKGSAVWYFYQTKTANSDVMNKLVSLVRFDSNSNIRQLAAMVLIELKPTSIEIQNQLAQAASTEQDSAVQYQLNKLIHLFNQKK